LSHDGLIINAVCKRGRERTLLRLFAYNLKGFHADKQSGVRQLLRVQLWLGRQSASETYVTQRQNSRFVSLSI